MAMPETILGLSGAVFLLWSSSFFLHSNHFIFLDRRKNQINLMEQLSKKEQKFLRHEQKEEEKEMARQGEKIKNFLVLDWRNEDSYNRFGRKAEFNK